MEIKRKLIDYGSAVFNLNDVKAVLKIMDLDDKWGYYSGLKIIFLTDYEITVWWKDIDERNRWYQDTVRELNKL
jgi:hypothetical protein